MNIKTSLFIVLLLLSGCNKKDRQTLPGISNNSVSSVQRTVLVMGQSNAVRLNPSGYKGWNDALQSNDIFINCAENGTTIAQWASNGSRMANCVSMTQGKKIDVILWYQGESDANPSIGGSSSDYAQKVTDLFKAFRSNWGNVPIVYAQIAVISQALSPSFPNWQEIKDQQSMISVTNTTMIKTDDIVEGNPLTLDGIHFDDPGDYVIGNRMAIAYKLIND